MTMQPEELRSRLEGPIAFPITPFHADLSLDRTGLTRNVERLLHHPPAAIVAPGGTGEMYSLTPEEHREVVRTVVGVCGSRIPVIAGVGFNAAIAADLAREAIAAGAQGILAFPPYYPQPDDSGLIEYYRAIGSATPAGLFIYSRDWFHPGPALVERLSEIPTLIAWKEGQADIRRLQLLMSHVGDRLRWIGGAGDDMVPAYYSAGLRAFTSSVANISSRVARQLHDCAATAAADDGLLRRVMGELIVPLYVFRARRRGYEVSVMKALMNLLDLPGGSVRPPLIDLTADDLGALRQLAPRWRSEL